MELTWLSCWHPQLLAIVVVVPNFEGGWCPGAESNHRHRDFQSRALPTELPGLLGRAGGPLKRARSLTVAPVAVHPFGIGRRSRDAIALAKPVQEVAVLAPAAAEGRMFGLLRLAAERAGLLGVRLFRHIPRTWGGKPRRATRLHRQPAVQAHRSNESSSRTRQ